VLRALTVVEYPSREGCCGAYYPEANSLVALEDHDPDCLTPSYKSVPVRILPAEHADDGVDTCLSAAKLTGTSAANSPLRGLDAAIAMVYVPTISALSPARTAQRHMRFCIALRFAAASKSRIRTSQAMA
jgi:hypothetical protein